MEDVLSKKGGGGFKGDKKEIGNQAMVEESSDKNLESICLNNRQVAREKVPKFNKRGTKKKKIETKVYPWQKTTKIFNNEDWEIAQLQQGSEKK